MLFSQDELAELPAKFRWGHSAISHILWGDAILSKEDQARGPGVGRSSGHRPASERGKPICKTVL